MVMFKKKAKERLLLLHPNSAIMGLNMTLKAYRAPDVKKRMKKEAAKIYQP
jgi:hypothetical protein